MARKVTKVQKVYMQLQEDTNDSFNEMDMVFDDLVDNMGHTILLENSLKKFIPLYIAYRKSVQMADIVNDILMGVDDLDEEEE